MRTNEEKWCLRGDNMKKIFYTCEDVKKILDVKNNKAYEIIRTLNKELEEKGYLIQQGRVNASYFNERYKIGD